MAHLTFLHFAKPVHAQSESPRVAVKASKERGERGDCISRPSLYHFPRASFGTSDRKVERHTKCALHRRLHDCTCRPRRASCRCRPPANPPLTCLSLQKSLRLEVTASEGARGQQGQVRVASHRHPSPRCVGDSGE